MPVGLSLVSRDDPQRQVGGFGLRFEHRTARAVHGDTVEFTVDGGEQADDFDVGLPAQDVEGPCTVFTAAPGQEDALHSAMVPLSSSDQLSVDSEQCAVEGK